MFFADGILSQYNVQHTVVSAGSGVGQQGELEALTRVNVVLSLGRIPHTNLPQAARLWPLEEYVPSALSVLEGLPSRLKLLLSR